MSYDNDPRDYGRRYVREDSRPERESRFADDSYLKPYSPRELIPRRREDSDLSVEEVRREFPPPGYRDARRARSAEPGHYQDYRYDDRSRDHHERDYYDRDYDRDYDRRGKKSSSTYYEDEEKKSRKRVLNQQEKIIAAVAGAALAFGGKELYDRYDAKENGTPVERNYLTSAALSAAGALAGYQGAEIYNKKAGKHDKQSQLIAHRGRDDDDDGQKKGAKSFLESALAASGLGAAVKAVTGGGSDSKDDKDDTRSRRGSQDGDSLARSKPRERDAGNDKFAKAQKAAMASLIAGATEAFRVAREPGGWKGEKTKRIVTAAAGAAAVDAAQGGDKDGKMSLAESVIGGLLGNRVINGSKSNIEEDKATGRSRSRSRAPSRSGADGGSGGVSGLAALATAGLGALGAKKAYDHVKDKRSPSRGRSADSIDSRDDRRQRSRSRSRSVVDAARKRLAKLGIGNGPDDRDADRDRRSRRDDSEYEDTRSSRRKSRRYSDESYDDDDNGRSHPSRGTGDARDPGHRDRDRDRDSRDSYYDDDRSYTSNRRRDRSRRRHGGRSDAGSDSDLGDSDDDLKTSRRMRDRRH